MSKNERHVDLRSILVVAFDLIIGTALFPVLLLVLNLFLVGSFSSAIFHLGTVVALAICLFLSVVELFLLLKLFNAFILRCRTIGNTFLMLLTASIAICMSWFILLNLSG